VTAVDTSVVVAGFAAWHEAHAPAAAALAKRPRIPAHVLAESFSVLTRLPPPHRAAAGLVAAFLGARFTDPPLVLPASEHRTLIEKAVAAGLTGGAIYDALIAATARTAGATLLTRDARARAVYDRMGVHYERVG
jgi:predicted nucleic acid-binding protein